MFAVTILFFINFLLLWDISQCQNNNVCPTFNDYRTMKDNQNCWYNFAAEAKVPDIIKRTGYPFMEYKVQTKDGYILTVFRIPSLNQNKSPVFLLHGVQSTSGIFVSLGRDSLAFLLADAGYDVWLGNYRGTEYSEEHAYLNVTMKEYWNYGADEIGLIDVPSMLNLVRYHTWSRGKIFYIGHSLATAASMMYASEYPDHAKKTIKLFIWMSPSYKLTNMRSPYRLFLPFVGAAMRLTTNLNLIQVISRGYSRRISRPTCLASAALMLICLNTLNLFTGPFTQIAPETVPVLFNQFPGGTSLKTFVYLQDAARGRFGKFDYGGRNMMLYGNSTAPDYNITKIQVPVFIFFARNDWATTRRDTLNLYQELSPKSRYGMFEIRNFNFNHFDFVFGRNAKRLVYDRLIKLLNTFNETMEETEE